MQLPRSDSSDFLSCNFVDKFLLHDMTIPGRRLPGKDTLPVSIGFNLQEDDAKFYEFPKSADDVDRPLKTYPDVPSEFGVSSWKQESRL